MQNLTPQIIQDQLSKIKNKENSNRIKRFILSALSSIPWVGGMFSATAAFHAEREQGRVNELHEIWLNEHNKKIELLGKTIYDIVSRIEKFGPDVKARFESEEYQDIVKKGFRAWDNADTDFKRELIRKLLTNSSATQICSDDVVRLFIDWINSYHEAHFYVIKEIFQTPNISRGQIWDKLNGTKPREDSPEADLYKMLIRDLSMGGVIRQFRETDYYGNFIKKPRGKSSSSTMKSAFDYEEPYELTELGKQFVHYTMNDIVPRIE